MGRTRSGAPAIALLLWAAVLGCRDGSVPAEPRPSPPPVPRPANADGAYVGAEACRDCHQRIYRTYERTGMGRSFSPLTADNTVGEFDGAPEIAIGGLHYRMFERDGAFFMQEFVRDSRGEPRAVAEHELVWVVGSNNHGRTYVIERDGKMFQAPLCWYPMESKWEYCPGYEHKNDHFTREISDSCMFCHNGVMRVVEERRNVFETPYPLGIGCERCHGPGAAHVAKWSSGEGFDSGEEDTTIVDPGRLPAAERQQVCFQCHLGDAKQTERVIRRERDPRSFRPGESINSVFVSFRYEQQTQYDFGLSAQADRMILSRCYTESGGRLECLTCHDPHVPVAEQPAGHYAQACATCHDVADCGEGHGARDAAGDDCVQCHMRRAEPDDQRFSLFTDHWIRKDVALATKDHREDFSIEPIFPDAYESLGEGERLYYEARALMQMSDGAGLEAQPGMLDEAASLFRRAIDAGYDTADLRYHLGKVLLGRGELDAAAAELEATLALDPHHRDALFALGQYHDRKGEKAQALAFFDRMLADDPDLAMALAERARVLFSQGDAVAANEFYRRALAQEPWNVTFVYNVGMTLAAQGKMREAAEYAERAARLNPDGASVWEFKANVLREIGDAEGSAEAAKRLAELRGGR